LGFPYSPIALPVCSVLAWFAPMFSFALWNVTLALGTAAVIWWIATRDGRRPWAWWGLLLLTSPGFILAWSYHKMILVLFPCLLWGLRLARQGHDIPAASLLAVLSIKPQLVPGLLVFLALRGRWRVCALTAGAMAILLLAVVPILGFSSMGEWREVLLSHHRLVLPFDSQSLFVAFYKPLRFIFPGPSRGVLIAEWVFLAVLMILGVWQCRKLKWEASFNRFWVYYLLALPYSTGADFLWAFPFFVETLESEERPWKSYGAKIGVAINIALAAGLGFYDPAGLARIAYQDRAGYLTCALFIFNGAGDHLSRIVGIIFRR